MKSFASYTLKFILNTLDFVLKKEQNFVRSVFSIPVPGDLIRPPNQLGSRAWTNTSTASTSTASTSTSTASTSTASTSTNTYTSRHVHVLVLVLEILYLQLYFHPVLVLVLEKSTCT